MASTDSDDDWRLCARLSRNGRPVEPHGIVARFRGPDLVHDAERAIGPDVHLTHDGSTLFAYAREREELQGARTALLAALESDGFSAEITLSRWEEDVGDWAQVDPPLDAASQAAHDTLVRDAHAPATQTFVVKMGADVRESFEQSMREWAERLGLRCELVEHPHLTGTQVAFTVSGPAHAVEEFRSGLQAEEWRTIRSAENLSFSI